MSVAYGSAAGVSADRGEIRQGPGAVAAVGNALTVLWSSSYGQVTSWVSHRRVFCWATIVVRVEGFTPLELATGLGERGFFTWEGNYYALNVTEQLGVESTGGFLRIGLVHYNTMDEVEAMIAAVGEARKVFG